MSNQKKKTAKKKTAKSKKSSTPNTEAINASLMEKLEQMSNLLQPTLEFHAEAEDADDEDLRMYWDVRLVRGAKQHYLRLRGTSTLTNILSDKMVKEASTLMGQEVADKIAKPMVAAMMRELEKRHLGNDLKDIDEVLPPVSSMEALPPPPPNGSGDNPVDIANEDQPELDEDSEPEQTYAPVEEGE